MGNCLGRHRLRESRARLSDIGLAAENWMSKIPDQSSTCGLSMPGTHESMSLYGGAPTECQTLTLTLQLQAGIRFVDIRCRHLNDTLVINHGIIYQKANFDDVLTAATQFLTASPTELIYMRVMEESTAENNTGTFAQCVQGYINRYPAQRFWTGPSGSSTGFPIVSDARGKIVIMRDYSGPATFGLSYGSMDIEDQWKIASLLPSDIDKKKDAVKSHLQKAIQGPTSTMYLTYSSGAGTLAWPNAVADRLDPFLTSCVQKKGRYGMIAMDFPGDQLISDIIVTNF